ncbi:Hypothetical predicted protein, partial [Paramuricea clavata]
ASKEFMKKIKPYSTTHSGRCTDHQNVMQEENNCFLYIKYSHERHSCTTVFKEVTPIYKSGERTNCENKYKTKKLNECWSQNFPH